MLSPEARTLLALTRDGSLDPDTLRHANVDAKSLLGLAQDHQVAGLASHTLRSAHIDPDDLSPGLHAALDPMRHSFLHHLLRNQVLEETLAELQQALSARGVRALFFKGPWLAFRAFPSPGTRPVGDIDLCIREDDYAAALEALRCIGYQPACAIPDDASTALRRAHYGQQLRFGARARRPVELHFRLVNCGPPQPEEWLWQHTRELELKTTRLLVPGPEAMLLHLAIHANQHGYAVLRLLHDIRWELELEGDELDQSGFLDLVAQLGCAASVYHSLLLAERLAGARAPPGLLEALRPSWHRRLLFGALWQTRRAEELRAPRWAMRLEMPRFYLLEMGGLSQKLRYASDVIRESGGPRRFLRRLLRGTGA